MGSPQPLDHPAYPFRRCMVIRHKSSSWYYFFHSVQHIFEWCASRHRYCIIRWMQRTFRRPLLMHASNSLNEYNFGAVWVLILRQSNYHTEQIRWQWWEIKCVTHNRRYIARWAKYSFERYAFITLYLTWLEWNWSNTIAILCENLIDACILSGEAHNSCMIPSKRCFIRIKDFPSTLCMQHSEPRRQSPRCSIYPASYVHVAIN